MLIFCSGYVALSLRAREVQWLWQWKFSCMAWNQYSVCRLGTWEYQDSNFEVSSVWGITLTEDATASHAWFVYIGSWRKFRSSSRNNGLYVCIFSFQSLKHNGSLYAHVFFAHSGFSHPSDLEYQPQAAFGRTHHMIFNLLLIF